MPKQPELCKSYALHNVLLFTFVNVFEWNIYNYKFLCQNENMSHRNVCYQTHVIVPTVILQVVVHVT